MADIVINSDTHNHSYTKYTPTTTVAMPTSVNWATCGLGHTNCDHTSMMSDTAYQYSSASINMAAKAVQTGDIVVNNNHSHTYDQYNCTLYITCYLISWKNCGAGDAKCALNSQTSLYGFWKAYNLLNPATYAQQSGGDIAVNWSHTHSYDQPGARIAGNNQMPGTCPNMHPMCQFKLTDPALLQGVQTGLTSGSNTET